MLAIMLVMKQTAYSKVFESIKHKIKSEVYAIGEQLPTNMEFCDIYGVSRITVNRALQELENEGYIEKRQGKGCFVKLNEIKQNITKFYSFSNELASMGFVPTSIFISLNLITATDEVKEALDLRENEKVYLLHRLRLADETIVAVDRSYIPEKYIKNFNKQMLKGGSLYDALEEYYGFRPNHSEEQIEAIDIDADDAEKMRVPVGTPCLLVKRVSYDSERKVEYNYRIVNSKVFKYKMSLE